MAKKNHNGSNGTEFYESIWFPSVKYVGTTPHHSFPIRKRMHSHFVCGYPASILILSDLLIAVDFRFLRTENRMITFFNESLHIIAFPLIASMISTPIISPSEWKLLSASHNDVENVHASRRNRLHRAFHNRLHYTLAIVSVSPTVPTEISPTYIYVVKCSAIYAACLVHMYTYFSIISIVFPISFVFCRQILPDATQ